MTRFARAKGSKSCNEKTPEDGTPWGVMKEQLLVAQNRDKEAKFKEEAEKKRLENYENFLKEQKVQKRKSVWCEFEETSSQQLKNNENLKNKKQLDGAKKKKYKTSKKTDANITNDISLNTNNLDVINVKQNNENQMEEQTAQKKKKKKHKNKANQKYDFETIENSNAEVINSNIEQTYNEHDFTSEVIKDKNHKKKKKVLKKEAIPKDDNDSTLYKNVDAQNDNEVKVNKSKSINQRKNKLIDGKPVRRKTLDDRSFHLIINGKEVQLLRFDGFPVMKKDAERLEELKRNMIKKGIPKSEVQRTMKLERRRAEKALARLKRDVCYNCRKGGHNLSDCPDLKSKIPGKDNAEGICFKCGSTEHRQFECKVQKDKEFRFATCFICKEPGHIARQCPDNPKGLYPNGGGCKLCKDVTHLRKDCPTIQDKKEETSLKLLTLDTTDNIEDIGGEKLKYSSVYESKKPKKIKF